MKGNFLILEAMRIYKDAVANSVFLVYFSKECALSSVVERSIHIRKAVGSIPTGRTRQEKSSGFGSPRFARRLIGIQFWG